MIVARRGDDARARPAGRWSHAATRKGEGASRCRPRGSTSEGGRSLRRRLRARAPQSDARPRQVRVAGSVRRLTGPSVSIGHGVARESVMRLMTRRPNGCSSPAGHRPVGNDGRIRLGAAALVTRGIDVRRCLAAQLQDDDDQSKARRISDADLGVQARVT